MLDTRQWYDCLCPSDLLASRGEELIVNLSALSGKGRSVPLRSQNKPQKVRCSAGDASVPSYQISNN